MPKRTRRKRDKVADFSKATLKLGKGKRLPSNVVDTSFRTRSIALPTQSISVQRDDAAPTNKRRQTLSDILSLLKHYNAGTRKDAISGARELFQDHPASLQRSIAPLLGACVRLIGDEDAGVRKTLLSFLDWLFARLDKNDLNPHVPLLLLFTASAQTHIFPEIRIDAVRFLDLLLDAVPESVVCGWNEPGLGHGKRALEGYLGILGAGTNFGGTKGAAQTTPATSVVLSPQSRLVVLRSLSSFLSHAIDPKSVASSESHGGVNQGMAAVPTWFLRPSFASARLYEEHANVLEPSHRGTSGKHLTWNIDPGSESFAEDFAYDPRLLSREADGVWNLSDLSLEMDDVSRPSGDALLITRLSQTLYPTLTASFLDGASVVFSPSTNPAETEVQMLTAAFRITRTLYGALLQSAGPGSDLLAAREELKTLLGYLVGYFPFTPAHRDAKAGALRAVEQALQDLCVIYCELGSLLALVSDQSTSAPSLRDPVSFDPQADLVKSYVIRLLGGNGGSGAQLPRPISTVTYLALLPTIWALLNRPTGRDGDPSVLEAVIDHAIRTPFGSAVKRLTIEFVGRLLLLESDVGYTGHFDPRDGDHGRKFQEWLVHLPRTLWELGAKDLATTQVVFGVLLRLVQRGSCVVQREEICSLSTRLTPFFVSVHPMRGQVLGPFSRIPCAASRVRRLALDLCATLVTDQTRRGWVDGNLGHAVSEAAKGTSEALYWEAVTVAMR